MEKIVIFGSNGLLGQSLVNRFHESHQVIAASLKVSNLNEVEGVPYHQVDMINRTEMKDFLSSESPDIIINAAAYTDVDGSEKERELCWNTNVRAVENIIDIANTFNPILVQVSTDYVFDGQQGAYTENDPVNPVGNYARSKMAAENIVTSSSLEHIIARTQVLYGTGNKAKLNFATWVISRLMHKENINVVTDQVGNPTYIDDLSESIFRLLQRNEYGLFHVSGPQVISRYEFAKKIAEVFELDGTLINRISTNDLKQAAPRPMNSSFVIDKLVNRIDWTSGDVVSGLERLKTKLNGKNG
ncbi:MAG: dTDP-4-dehydrorhamnose reductase [Calditrichaeota bacterium]|nr:MAG: dTDP-4-dehydrorhamnose reductase [Calditrichota bacterium]MBL1207576.1 dTDP-4-dehydrorhamnose reductase [Calditrichota bacterium]NOG47408.1 dTDP-4-dehydrorhamnose reductase [Calditrichota bacterium]